MAKKDSRLDRWLVSTCTIERPVDQGGDPLGQPVELWIELLADEPCRLVNISPGSRPEEISDAMKVGAVLADYNLFLHSDRAVVFTERDRVRDVKTASGAIIVGGPLDVILVVDRFGRTGEPEYNILYLARRGQN